MNLNTITQLMRPVTADEITQWRNGYAWLAGGTWLFSEPQIATDTLIDLEGLRWPSLTTSNVGLEIAATCRIAELAHFLAPAAWRAAPLLEECCNALLASWKIWNEATVGGNICMSLPAGSMLSLTCALEATYVLWPREGAPRTVAAVDFAIGNHANILQAGELLRSIHLPATALSKRFAVRRGSLTKLGRSAALLIGTRAAVGDDLLLTITAATPRPIQLAFAHAPSAHDVRVAIDERIPADGWFDDVNGSAAWKRHLAHYYAEQIRVELAQSGDAA